MNPDEITIAYSTDNRKKYIDDIISLLRLIDTLNKDFLGELSSIDIDNVAELGIRLDAINRFGHCIMDELIEEGFW